MGTVTLRLTVPDPVPGVHYYLQDKDNAAVGAVLADGRPLVFDIPVTLKDDGRLTGAFVRREGKERRFVYVAMQGGPDAPTDPQGRTISRRAKIDIHDIPAALLKDGATLEATLPGRDANGLPPCATVRPVDAWRAV
jgi:hypothetical protein